MGYQLSPKAFCRKDAHEAQGAAECESVGEHENATDPGASLSASVFFELAPARLALFCGYNFLCALSCSRVRLWRVVDDLDAADGDGAGFRVGPDCPGLCRLAEGSSFNIHKKSASVTLCLIICHLLMS